MLNNEDLGAELERVRTQDGQGMLRPKSVVDAARPATSPLHAHFEWDDSEAGERYRIIQARQLIRVVVTHAPSPHQGVLIRAYTSLSADRRQPEDEEEIGGASGYRSTSDVLSNEQLREILLADALRELKTFEAKYSKLEQLKPIFEALQRVRATPTAASGPAKRRRGRAPAGK